VLRPVRLRGEHNKRLGVEDNEPKQNPQPARVNSNQHTTRAPLHASSRAVTSASLYFTFEGITLKRTPPLRMEAEGRRDGR
jgi:hypothetical protein